MQDTPDHVLSSHRAESGLANPEDRAWDDPRSVDGAGFEETCKRLERSLVRARASDDRVRESIACSAIGALFNEMGCHADAMAAIDRSLSLAVDTPQGERLRFVNATHGLFGAHRAHDEGSALRYMAIGSDAFDNSSIDASERTAFEVRRAQYLLAHDDAETAELLIEAALRRCCETCDERVRIPLETAAALCDWASLVVTRQDGARKKLRELYHRSRRTRVHHDAVLRALVQVHGRTTPREVSAAHAKELVEYGIDVKRAELVRQIRDRQRRGVGGAAAPQNALRTAACEVAENWAVTAAFSDEGSGEHCFRVGRLASLLAAELGMDVDDCVRIDHAARLHDIGRVAVDERALSDAFDRRQLAAMRAEAGGMLLRQADDLTLRMAAVIAGHHEAWWNGTGHPRGLAGDHVPLEARICALAAVYVTLTTAQPNKRAWPHRTALEQMMCDAGVRFDPRLMTPFLRVLERHVGCDATPPSTRTHRTAMDANGLVVARRALLTALHPESDRQGRSGR